MHGGVSPFSLITASAAADATGTSPLELVILASGETVVVHHKCAQAHDRLACTHRCGLYFKVCEFSWLDRLGAVPMTL